MLYVFGKCSDFPLNIEYCWWPNNTVGTITLLAAAVLRSVRSCRHLPRGGGLRGAGGRVAGLHARGPGPRLVRCQTLHLLQVGGGFRPRFPRPVNFWNIAKILPIDWFIICICVGVGSWITHIGWRKYICDRRNVSATDGWETGDAWERRVIFATDG